MPHMPELPVNVPLDQVQQDGVRDMEPIYQTHRGKQPKSRDTGTVPPTITTPDQALRWVLEGNTP